MTHWADRSSHETGHACPRKLFWSKYHEGIGLTPVGAKFDLEFGKLIHSVIEGVPECTAPLAESLGDTVTPDGHLAYTEAITLAAGLSETYRRFTLPRLLEEFDFVGHEVEMVMDLGGGVKWMSRLDGILRRKSDGLYFVLEAKTTSAPEALMRQSRTNFQLLMECEALRRYLGEKSYNCADCIGWRDKSTCLKCGGTGKERVEVGGALLLVFNKGSKRQATKTEQNAGRDGFRRLSPFTYWYTKGGDEDGAGRRQVQLDWAKGWTRTPTWTIPDWYDLGLQLFPDEFKQQVQVWPSVDFDPVRVESVLRQVKAREGHFQNGLEWMSWEVADDAALIDDFFPQNFSNCSNDRGFGRPCEFFDACFSPQVGRDPLGSGLFEKRVPNHRKEREALNDLGR